ncbi:Slc10a1, partial [Symbiodinium sp. KB8]
MVWAKRVAIFASGLGVLFILAALIFGSISETAIWKAPWQLFVSSAILLLLGAAARTIALETGIQNSTFTITVLTFSFGGEGQDTEVFNEVLLFPLLYSFFLIVDGILLTALFHYLARFDPEEEKAAYADEEAKRAAELEAEEAGQAGGEGETQPGEGTQLVVVGAATPTGGESPSAASEGTDSEGKDVEQGTSGVA